jgi:hypothetical protein
MDAVLTRFHNVRCDHCKRALQKGWETEGAIHHHGVPRQEEAEE